jgi:hypothetical protein
MTIGRMHVLPTVGALLISVQLCFAADERRQTFESMWAAFGEQAKEELVALPEKGRSAFREALIACSVYADDEYDSPTHRDKCETGSQFFVHEFSHNWSAMDVLFQMAISYTSVRMTHIELDHLHGRREITDDDTRRGIIDVLERAYRETGERK